MSDTADGLGTNPEETSTPGEEADAVTTPSQHDPTETDHPTGQAQAAENEDLELPG